MKRHDAARRVTIMRSANQDNTPMGIPRGLQAFALCAGACLFGMTVSAHGASIATHVGTAIHPAKVMGQTRLVYELHVNSASTVPIELTTLDALASDGKPLRHLDEKSLDSRINSNDGGTVIAPHAQAVLYLTLDVAGAPPPSIRHLLGLKQGDREWKFEGPAVVVPAADGPVLAPPLAGGPWVAVYSDGWPRGHRRVFITTHGHARLPGRFAIDWMKVDDHGRTLKDDSGLATASFSYGATVRAVADARVAAVRDGVTEAARIADNKSHPHPDAAGNFISLDLGNGRFATYEHLRTGSVKVAKGDHVRKGQPIAEVGFSGDSTEPHLHFHVSDSPLPLEGEGLPYALNHFRVTGRVTDWNAFGSQRWPDLQPHIVKHEFPESGDVVDFD